jgi:hypothetical protein
MPPTRAQGANQALEDAWALAAALRGAAKTEAGPEAALRAFERTRSRKASVVSRQAGSEDYNRYGAILSRLIPGPLATRYYTRWLRQISTYLDPATNASRLTCKSPDRVNTRRRGHDRGNFFLCVNSADDSNTKLPRSFSGLPSRAAGGAFEAAGAAEPGANLARLPLGPTKPPIQRHRTRCDPNLSRTRNLR